MPFVASTVRGRALSRARSKILGFPALVDTSAVDSTFSGCGVSKLIAEFKVPSNAKSANPELLGFAKSGRPATSTSAGERRGDQCPQFRASVKMMLLARLPQTSSVASENRSFNRIVADGR